MSEPFLGEIKIFSFNFAPRGWGQCNGQLLPINQNQALFALLGTQFGGNGQTNFALPDLRSRTPLGFGTIYAMGQATGTESVTLQTSQIPAHTHTPKASSADGTAAVPTGQVWAASSSNDVPKYAAAASPRSAMAGGALTQTGGNQPHINTQPYLTLNFCIALQGIFPSRN